MLTHNATCNNKFGNDILKSTLRKTERSNSKKNLKEHESNKQGEIFNLRQMYPICAALTRHLLDNYSQTVTLYLLTVEMFNVYIYGTGNNPHQVTL